jgi:hypothetical protein
MSICFKLIQKVFSQNIQVKISKIILLKNRELNKYFIKKKKKYC